MATRVGTHTIEKKNAHDALTLVAGKGQVSATSGKGALATTQQKGTVQTVTGGAILRIGARTGEVSGFFKSANMNSMYNLEDMTLLTDSEILDAITRGGTTLGFCSAEEVPLPAGMLISAADLMALRKRLLKEGLVAKHAGGQTVLSWTATGDARAVVSLRAVGTQKAHHGGTLVIVLQIKNTGAVPLRELYCFLPVPKHTTHNSFLFTELRGFAALEFREERLLCWKLYETLQPGNSFRAAFKLNLDKWKL